MISSDPNYKTSSMDLDFLCPTLVTIHGHDVLTGAVQDKFSKLDYVIVAILNQYSSSALCTMISCQ